MGSFGLLLVIWFAFYALISVAMVVLWIIALVDILKSDFKDNTTKILWVVLVIVLPIIGSILYFIIGRKQKIQKMENID